jgi:hypothetical protein
MAPTIFKRRFLFPPPPLLVLILASFLWASCIAPPPDAAASVPAATATGEPSIVGKSSEGEMGMLPDKPEDASLPPEEKPGAVANVDWQTYTNKDFGYSIDYPQNYTPLPTPDIERYIPSPLDEITFFRQAVITNQATSYTPPDFAIRVYAHEPETTLFEWLRAHQLLGAQDPAPEPYSVSGSEGVKVCATAPIAPECIIYILEGEYIFALIPNGDYAETMLASFRFAQ